MRSWIAPLEYMIDGVQMEAVARRVPQAEYTADIVAAWALAVWAGVLGTVLLLLRKRLAVGVLLVSLLSMIVTSVYNFILSDGMEVMGSGAVAFSGLIFVIALGLWLYARAMAQRGVLVQART